MPQNHLQYLRITLQSPTNSLQTGVALGCNAASRFIRYCRQVTQHSVSLPICCMSRKECSDKDFSDRFYACILCLNQIICNNLLLYIDLAYAFIDLEYDNPVARIVPN